MVEWYCRGGDVLFEGSIGFIRSDYMGMPRRKPDAGGGKNLGKCSVNIEKNYEMLFTN